MPLCDMADLRNCAVRERTADGVSVGRCWTYLDEKDNRLFCPRHGDVSKCQKHFEETRELSEDPRDL